MKLRDLLIVASAKVRDEVVAGTNIIACNLELILVLVIEINIIACNLELLMMIWTLWQIL